MWDTVHTIYRAGEYRANHISLCGILCKVYLALETMKLLTSAMSEKFNQTKLFQLNVQLNKKK